MLFRSELRLRSPADRAFRWTLGAYWFKQSDDLTRDDKATPDARIVPNGAAALFNRDLENQAVFGGIEYDLAERWTATAEFRHAQDKRRQAGAQYATTPVAASRCAPGGDGIQVSTSPTTGCVVSSGVRVPVPTLQETFDSDKPRSPCSTPSSPTSSSRRTSSASTPRAASSPTPTSRTSASRTRAASSSR